jgi:thiamine biosynthesis lipoprotein
LARDGKRLLLEVVAFLVVVALIIVYTTRARRGDETNGATGDSRILMGTLVSVTIFGADEEPARGAIEAAFEEIGRIEALATTYSPASAVSVLNEASRSGGPSRDGGTTLLSEPEEAPSIADADLAAIVRCALEVSEASDGAFDVTVAPLVGLWRLGEGDFKPPCAETIARALSRVDYRLVSVDGDRVELTGGAEINLDGVAKGYAVDRAVAVIAEAAVDAAIVDAGGDIGLLGASPHPEGWRVGIRHPRGDGLLGVLRLDGGGVATSGDYQRFEISDGVRQHHILDPSNGYPARGVVSVTIVAETSAVADALATAVFVMGAERGMALVERMDGVEVLIVTGDEEIADVLLSSGLLGRYEDTSGLGSVPSVGRAPGNRERSGR